MNTLKNKTFLIPLFLILICCLNFFLLHLDAIEVVSLLSYLLLSWLFGVVTFPFMTRAIPKLNASSYAVAKVLGVASFFYILWILNHVDFLCGPWASTILLLAVIYIFFKFSQDECSLLFLKNSRELLSIEILFLTVFLTILSLYALHPELYWGEKPMDFTLLNYFARYPSLPPSDPWLADETMHYYYWGYFYLAQLGNMAGLSGEVSFGAGLALSAALFSCSLYAIFSLVLKGTWNKLWSCLLLLFSSNFAATFNVLKDNSKLNMQYFWSSTRVFSGGAFAEYPIWSFLFADLHAHVLSYPFSICFLTLVLYGFKNIWGKFNFRMHKPFIVVYAFSYGTLMLVNGWDFIIYSLLATILWAFEGPKYWKKINYWFSFLLTHLFGILLISPIFLTLLGGAKKKLFLSPFKVNEMYSFFLFWGAWFVILALCAPFYFRKKNGERLGFPFLKLLLASLFMVLLAEQLVFMDRINTIFKTYTNLYIWFGVVAISSTFFLLEKSKKRHSLYLLFPVFVVFTLQLLGSGMNITAVLGSRAYGKIGTGLKGTDYLKRFNFEDFQIINWLRVNTVGLPTILEKDAESFNHSGARISMHTGLPTYMGWHNHVRLRGASNDLIDRRRSMISYLYGNPDALKVHEQLQQLGISFIVLGKFERSHMSIEAIAKFETFTDLFTPLLTVEGRGVLFGVRGFQAYLKSDKISPKEGNE